MLVKGHKNIDCTVCLHKDVFASSSFYRKKGIQESGYQNSVKWLAGPVLHGGNTLHHNISGNKLAG